MSEQIVSLRTVMGDLETERRKILSQFLGPSERVPSFLRSTTWRRCDPDGGADARAEKREVPSAFDRVKLTFTRLLKNAEVFS